MLDWSRLKAFANDKIDWLTVWCFTPYSKVFQLYCGGQCTYPCFPGVLLTSTPHNILSKPLAAFTHNYCRNNGQRWKRNESCRNDYHQSSKNILAEPWIEPATSCSQVGNTTDWAIGLGCWWQMLLNFVTGRQCSLKSREYEYQHHEQVLLFPQCFQKLSLSESFVFLPQKKKAFENIVGSGENAGNQHFPPYPKTNFKFWVT